MVRVAAPEALRVPEPRVVEPSLKVTVPVGVTAQLMVAVSVTDWPGLDGLGDAVRPVVVDAALTTWLTGDEVLVAQLVSPA